MGSEVVAGVRKSQQGFLDSARTLTAAEVAAPSLLPGWTRGMLIAHVTSAGRAALRCVKAAGRGVSAEMYPGGESQRDTEIDSGRNAGVAALVADLADVCGHLDAGLASLPAQAWDLSMKSRRGSIPMRVVAVQRWLDVEAHRVDLDTGYTTADWSAAFVDVALPAVIEVLPALRERPDADRTILGSWRLCRSDGEGDWTLHADSGRGWVETKARGESEIRAAGHVLLAILLGRAYQDPGNVAVGVAERIKSAFPGP